MTAGREPRPPAYEQLNRRSEPELRPEHEPTGVYRIERVQKDARCDDRALHPLVGVAVQEVDGVHEQRETGRLAEPDVLLQPRG